MIRSNELISDLLAATALISKTGWQPDYVYKGNLHYNEMSRLSDNDKYVINSFYFPFYSITISLHSY